MVRDWIPQSREFAQQGLLRTRTTTSENAEKTEQNAKHCRLFSKLSPELRNRVYVFVLGDRDVHVHNSSAQPGVFEQHICLTAHKPTDPSKKYLQQHDMCFETSLAAQSRLSMTLLQTCRQIYDEACLISFVRNEFIIDFEACTSFMRKFNTKQKSAIERLTMFAAGRPFHEGSISIHDVKDLVNLTQLSIISVQNNESNFPFKGLEVFARWPLESISFQISSRDEVRREDRIVDLQAASRALQAKLLRSWAEVEREGKGSGSAWFAAFMVQKEDLSSDSESD